MGKSISKAVSLKTTTKDQEQIIYFEKMQLLEMLSDKADKMR
jgi:hypothetical protein